MDSVSLSDISYLLFVIPGFVLIWSYRYFTKAEKPMGEFEYAAWSFIWGFPLLAILMISSHFSGHAFPSTPLNDPFSILGGLMGISLAQATVLALPLGYIGALLSHWGLFRLMNHLLFKPLKSWKF